MAPLAGKYGIHDRVAALESEVNGIRIDLDNKLVRPGPAGPSGPQGVKGDSCVGPAGRDGRDGKDSTIPGPVSTVPGPAGPKGVGERGPAGADSAAVLQAVRAELATTHKEFEDLKLVVNAIYEQNKQASGYIEYLRSLAAARIATRK